MYVCDVWSGGGRAARGVRAGGGAAGIGIVCVMRLLVASLAAASVCAAGIKEPTGSKVEVLNKDLFQRFVSRCGFICDVLDSGVHVLLATE